MFARRSLQEDPKSLESRNKDGWTPLHQAAFRCALVRKRSQPHLCSDYLCELKCKLVLFVSSLSIFRTLHHIAMLVETTTYEHSCDVFVHQSKCFRKAVDKLSHTIDSLAQLYEDNNIVFRQLQLGYFKAVF